MIGFLTAPLRIGIEKVPDEVSHVYKLTFPKIACRLFCWFSGDANDFHNHWKDANACVPGAMIFSGVGGLISLLMPGMILREVTKLVFSRPVLVGKSVIVSFSPRFRSGPTYVMIMHIVDEGGNLVCKDTQVKLLPYSG